MINNKRDLDKSQSERDCSYVGNMAIDLYENVVAEFPDIHSSCVTWLDTSGDMLTMVIYKDLD
jgi:hypothetical protein